MLMTKLSVILISTVGFGAGWAWHASQDPQDKLKELPPAVRSAAEKALAGASVTAVDKETEHGCESFEINGKTKDGVSLSFTFTTAGEMMVEERGIPAEKLPAAVAAAVAKKFPKGKVLRAETVVKHLYEVAVEVDGKKHGVEVQANGAIEDSESDDEDAKGEGDKKAPAKGGKDEKK